MFILSEVLSVYFILGSDIYNKIFVHGEKYFIYVSK